MSKHDLIDMVITEKSKKEYTRENDDLTKEEAKLLKNNNFVRQQLKENILPKVRGKPKPLNN